jgi:hypothetical protein
MVHAFFSVEYAYLVANAIVNSIGQVRNPSYDRLREPVHHGGFVRGHPLKVPIKTKVPSTGFPSLRCFLFGGSAREQRHASRLPDNPCLSLGDNFARQEGGERVEFGRFFEKTNQDRVFVSGGRGQRPRLQGERGPTPPFLPNEASYNVRKFHCKSLCVR